MLPQESVSNWTKFNNWLFARQASTILSNIFNEVKDVKKDVFSNSNQQKIDINSKGATWVQKEENPYVFIDYSKKIKIPKHISEQDKKMWQHVFKIPSGIASGIVGRGVEVQIKLTPEQKALSPIQYTSKDDNNPKFSQYYIPPKQDGVICRFAEYDVYGSKETQTHSHCYVYQKQLEALMNTPQKS